METIATAKIMKELIEEKEFFLYPHREVKEFYDIVLYKQSWLNVFFIMFLEEAFLYSSLEYQKSIIYNLYSEVKIKNRFKKYNFYFVINASAYEESCVNKLKDLSTWIKDEGINANILVLDITKSKSLWFNSNFEDKENLVHYFENRNPYIHHEFEEINLLDVEKNTKISKGYYLPQEKGYLTKLFMAINILFFAYISTQGGTTDIYNLIKFGAKYNPLIADGEYYRLFTNMFIHIGIVHLLLNTYALNILGKDAEAIYGRYRFIFIYIISGIFGSLGSFIFSNAVSAGASGAIFGLMGSYLYFGIRKPLIFSARYGMNLITLLIINIVFGLSNGNIDNFAHFGGLLGGFLTSWSLGLRKEKLYTSKRLFAQVSIVLVLLSLLFVGVQKNQEAWEYNFHKGIKHLQQEDLKNAKAQFQIGLQKNQNIAELHFYLAYILYYEGNKDAAIEHLNKTLLLNPQDSMAQKFLEEITAE